MIHENALQKGGGFASERSTFIPVLRIEWKRAWRTVPACSGRILNEKAQACNGRLGFSLKVIGARKLRKHIFQRHKHIKYTNTPYPPKDGSKGSVKPLYICKVSAEASSPRLAVRLSGLWSNCRGCCHCFAAICTFTVLCSVGTALTHITIAPVLPLPRF